MKLLVFSDSHRHVDPMRKVLDKMAQDVHAVLHLGDCADDARAIAALYPGCKHFGVSGNCDFYESDGSCFPDEQILSFFGCKLYLSHGHPYGVKMDYDRITYRARELDVHICLFGHTHVPATFTWEGVHFMNPGSISLPRQGGYPTFGVVEIAEDGTFTTTVVGKINNLYRPVDVSM